MADSKSKEKEPSGLKKSLRLIYVYAIAAGAIFTFIGYWDTIFYEYCGAGTFFGFIFMTLLILPIAMVYCELAPLFPKAGGELIYNTVGINRHVGFFSSWLIMAAWIAVPPSAVMAIVQWMFHVLHVNSSFFLIEGVALVALVGYCCLSLQNVEIAGKIQLYMLIFAIGGCIVATVAFLFSGVWSLDNFKNFFYSQVGSQFGIPSWFIGMALLITPFFGFETVPQMVEEGDFPIKDSNKAILGSIVSCGLVYALFFFGLGGMPVQSLVEEGGAAVNGFLAITMMEQLGGGWSIFAVIFGVAAILCAIGTCLLGFWLSTVRLMYAMGENNFLPKAFTKLNRHQQPVLPNILLLIIGWIVLGKSFAEKTAYSTILLSVIFLLLQNATTFMNDFFNLMSFGCACAYALTMISAMRIRKKYPQWVSPYKLKGGNITRILALLIAIMIAFFCTLGQSAGSWKAFGIYLGVGVVLWLWMVLVNWKKHPVEIETPDGVEKF